ncbi:MAG: glycosyltransferase [candidate division Zixibacteria bacterium]|nr:glycosyltransferase [candidate division Zixibacteria bacterium]
MVKGPDPGIRSTAMALIESGDFREAEVLIKKLINDYPDNASVACLMADCYAQMPNYEGAEFWFRKAITLQPYNVDFSIHYNIFRIDNLHALPKDRPRYLVGPNMRAAYSFANYADCVFYCRPGTASGHRSEIEVLPDADIESILSKCPSGFSPDRVICLLPEYFAPPSNIEKCACTTVGIYTDLPAHSEMIAATAPLMDICLTQGFREGPQMLLKLGANRSGSGFFIGHDPLFWKDRNKQRDIDILFLSTFSLPFIYNGRNEIIHELLPLAKRYNLVIGTENQQTSAELQSRAKIVVNCSHSGELSSEMIARRIFESMSCGTLCFAEDEVAVVKQFYRDKSEIVFYKLKNLVTLLESYIRSSEERHRIADAGKRKTVNNYTYADNISGITHLLQARGGLMRSDNELKLSRAQRFLRRGISQFYSHLDKTWGAITNLFEKALDQDPQFEAIVKNNLGGVAANQGLYDKALKHFDTAIELECNPIYTANQILTLVYLKGDPKRALNSYNRMEQLAFETEFDILPLYLVCRPNSVLPTTELTRSLYFLRIQDAYLKYPDRDKRFFDLIGKIVQAEIEKAVGYAYECLDDRENAIEHYEKALGEYYDDFEMIFTLSRLHKNSDNRDKASEYSEKAFKLQPLNMEYLVEYFSHLYDSENFNELFELAENYHHTDLRISGDQSAISFFRALAAEKIQHDNADNIIAEFLRSSHSKLSQESGFGELARSAVQRWSQ